MKMEMKNFFSARKILSKNIEIIYIQRMVCVRTKKRASKRNPGILWCGCMPTGVDCVFQFSTKYEFIEHVDIKFTKKAFGICLNLFKRI